jgi:hypothetical protein
MDGYKLPKLPSGVRKSDLGPLQEQQVLLIMAGPSFQSLSVCVCVCVCVCVSVCLSV